MHHESHHKCQKVYGNLTFCFSFVRILPAPTPRSLPGLWPRILLADYLRLPDLLGSGAGTNLKVVEGHMSGAKHWKLLVVPSSCLALQEQLIVLVLVRAYVMVCTVWSVSCLLFYSRCLACQTIAKSGRHVPLPRALWSRRHCS